MVLINKHPELSLNNERSLNGKSIEVVRRALICGIKRGSVSMYNREGCGRGGGIFVLTAGEFAFQEDGGAEII